MDVVIERLLHASQMSVWKAITDAHEMRKWFFDLKEFRPKPDFEFTFTGGKDGRQYIHHCRVTEVVEGRHLTYTWTYEGYEGTTFVTWELVPQGHDTLLRLKHEGLDDLPADNPDFAPSNFLEGWNHIIGTSLTEYLAKIEPVHH